MGIEKPPISDESGTSMGGAHDLSAFPAQVADAGQVSHGSLSLSLLSTLSRESSGNFSYYVSVHSAEEGADSRVPPPLIRAGSLGSELIDYTGETLSESPALRPNIAVPSPGIRSPDLLNTFKNSEPGQNRYYAELCNTEDYGLVVRFVAKDTAATPRTLTFNPLLKRLFISEVIGIWSRFGEPFNADAQAIKGLNNLEKESAAFTFKVPDGVTIEQLDVKLSRLNIPSVWVESIKPSNFERGSFKLLHFSFLKHIQAFLRPC